MDLAEHIFINRAPVAAPEAIADILARLVWLTSDNGAEICRSLRRWLAEGDQDQVTVALAFDEIFLWDSAQEMEAILASVVLRFPSLTSCCESNRVQWFKQHPNKSFKADGLQPQP